MTGSGHERTLHVAVIPVSVRSPVALVHLTGSEVDDLATLRWLYHPEQGWALAYDPARQVGVNVRATLLARAAGPTPDFICGPAVLANTSPDSLVELADITHDLLTNLHLDRFG